MLYSIFIIIIGFILLIAGAEWTVKGSVAIANKMKIPMIIIGLTIVALGTSLPEFIVSVKAALNGAAGISIGNVVGSNIANILLILGSAAIFYPIKCRRRIFLRNYKFLFLVSALFAAFSISGKFVFWHGIILLGLLLGFIYYNYKNASKVAVSEDSLSPLANKNWILVIAITIIGLSAIMYGADFLVNGAINIAKILGVSDEIIGLTIIAVGTSLPELATTIVAAIKKQNDVALGNIIGSNIWNIVFIMGFTSVVTDVNVSQQFMFYDVWVMFLATLLLYPVMMTKARMNRFEGIVFVSVYVLYILSQIMIVKSYWNFGY